MEIILTTVASPPITPVSISYGQSNHKETKLARALLWP